MSNQEQQAYQLMNSEQSPLTVKKYLKRDSIADEIERYRKDVQPVRGTTEPAAEPESVVNAQPLVVGDNRAQRAGNPMSPIDFSRPTQLVDARPTKSSKEKTTNPIAQAIYWDTQRLKRSKRTVVPPHSDGVGQVEIQRVESVEMLVMSTEQLAVEALQAGYTLDNLERAA